MLLSRWGWFLASADEVDLVRRSFDLKYELKAQGIVVDREKAFTVYRLGELKRG